MKALGISLILIVLLLGLVQIENIQVQCVQLLKSHHKDKSHHQSRTHHHLHSSHEHKSKESKRIKQKEIKENENVKVKKVKQVKEIKIDQKQEKAPQQQLQTEQPKQQEAVESLPPPVEQQVQQQVAVVAPTPPTPEVQQQVQQAPAPPVTPPAPTPPPPVERKRSPLQLPDIIAGTQLEVELQKDDGISKASDIDMKAYSLEVANGGNAATLLEAMAPVPIKAEDDSGCMSMFMSDLESKAESLEDPESDKQNKEQVELDDQNTMLNPDASGADFAAMFGQELAEKQRDKDQAEQANAAPLWFQNTASPPSNSLAQVIKTKTISAQTTVETPPTPLTQEPLPLDQQNLVTSDTNIDEIVDV